MCVRLCVYLHVLLNGAKQAGTNQEGEGKEII